MTTPPRRRRAPASQAEAAIAPPLLAIDVPAIELRVIELRGSLDEVTSDGAVHGWCWSPDEPETRRRVTVLVDGAEAVRTVADLLREDLQVACVGDGGHGFAVEVPETARTATDAVAVTLQDTQTGRPVGAERVVIWRHEEAPPLTGNIDTISRDGWVSGWCWDPDEAGRRLTLAIRIDGETVGTMVAEDSRPDLETAGVGDGNYGFTFVLPYEVLADRGVLRVEVIERRSGRRLGEPALVQIGRRAAEQRRIHELERQLTVLRGRLDQLTRLAEERAAGDERAARAMFGMVAAFFADLADGASPAAASLGPPGGVAAALESMRGLGPPFTLRLPETDAAGRPRVAIVVICDAPVERVHACLLALHATAADAVAEIVLLAPTATDPRCALLPAVVGNLRVSAGTGLPAALASLLQTADVSVVAVVSPDVLPQPGWLPALLATLAAEPQAAAVGAVVLRADGLAHHAGFVLRDGLYGDLAATAAADAPEQRVMRPVDAVAPLCLVLDMVRVRAAGGIDGLYGDLAAALADLCVRLRTSGACVLRQPAARALWAGPASRDVAHLPDRLPATSEDTRRLQLALARPESRRATAVIAHALVVDDEMPDPERDGGSVVTIEHMQVLRRLGWLVSFMPASGTASAPALREQLERAGVEVIGPADSPSVTEYLRDHAADLDLVQIYRWRNAALLLPRVRDLAPRARTVFSPADLHFLRETRGALLAGRVAEPQDRLREQEMACVRAADATLVLSEHERFLLAEEVDPAKLHLVRWVGRPLAAVPGFSAREGIAFIGHFRHPPNVDAALWWAREIAPLVRARRPGLVLDVVGRDAPPAVAALVSEDMRLRGWVADLPALLAGARLTVAPLRYGAGMKGKVAVSLAHGVPVVGTSIAFEGSGLADGDGIVVADDADTLAQAVAALYDDPDRWRVLSERARERVGALYSPEAAADLYRAMLADLGLPAAGP